MAVLAVNASMMRYWRYGSSLVIHLVLCCCNSYAFEQLELSDGDRAIDLTPATYFLVDSTGQLNINEAQALPTSAWTLNTHQQGRMGFIEQAIWLRIEVNITRTASNSGFVHLKFPRVRQLQFFSFIDGVAGPSYRTGDQLGFAQKPVPHRNYLLPLNLQKTSKLELFLRINSSTPIVFPLELTNQRWFFINDQYDQAIQFIFLGAFLLLILYNLNIFFITGDVAHIYYAALVLSVSMYNFSLHGYDFQYLWPDSPALHESVVWTSVALSFIFSSLFCMSFLQTKTWSPNIHRFLQALFIITLPLLALALSRQYQLFEQVMSWVIPAYLSLMFIGIAAWKSGQQQAKYYTVGWLCLFIPIIVILASYQLKMQWLPQQNVFLLSGSFAQALFISLALAEKLRYINKVRMRNITLEKQNLFKTAFLQNMSHELRTPLNSIIGFSKILHRKAKDRLNDREFEGLETVITNGKHLLSLINTVLDLGKIESGKLELNKELIKPSEICREAISLLQTLAEDKNLSINLDVTCEKDIYADKTRLLQIIINVLSNAIKFTDQGKILITIAEHKQSLLIKVRDTGAGISQQDMAEIFYSFGQIDKDKQQGSGLGLVISKQIAELHDGSLTVSSEVGKGSEFVIALPLGKSQQQSVAPTAS